MARLLIIIILVIGQGAAWAGDSTGKAKDASSGLSALLPAFEGIKPDGVPKKAQTPESLFGCINGGAELFIRNGFEQAIFQTYVTEKDHRFNLEIYKMKSGEGARQIYAKNTTPEDKKADVGEAAVIGNYYLIFRKAGYYVALTGFEPGSETLELLLKAGRSVEKKIIGNQ